MYMIDDYDGWLGFGSGSQQGVSGLGVAGCILLGGIRYGTSWANEYGYHRKIRMVGWMA